MGIDREACFKVGMDDFISKPIDWGEMLKALKKAAEVLGSKATTC
jgi:CheY-like chemotaxis protein